MIPSDNLGPALLTWQLELDTQFSQPMASSSTPISYDPFPGNTSPRSRFIGHATPRQDDYDRPPYSNSQSLPPADNHSLYLNPGGQHMGNYPSTTGHGTPSTTPDLYQVPSQYFILSNDIPPPFDESFRHRGQGIPFMHYLRYVNLHAPNYSSDEVSLARASCAPEGFRIYCVTIFRHNRTTSRRGLVV